MWSTHSHIYMPSYIPTYTHINLHTYIKTYINAQNTYIHTYTNIYRGTYMYCEMGSVDFYKRVSTKNLPIQIWFQI